MVLWYQPLFDPDQRRYQSWNFQNFQRRQVLEIARPEDDLESGSHSGNHPKGVYRRTLMISSVAMYVVFITAPLVTVSH